MGSAHGFFRDLDYDASFILPWAVRFRKSRDPIPSTVVASYERRLWHLEQEKIALREQVIEQRNKLAESEEAKKADLERSASYESRLSGLEEANTRLRELSASYESRLSGLEEANTRLREESMEASKRLSRIDTSRGWRALQLYYRARDKVLRPNIRRASSVRSVRNYLSSSQPESTAVDGKEFDRKSTSVGQASSNERKLSLFRRHPSSRGACHYWCGTT
jgi:hypothetical protein